MQLRNYGFIVKAPQYLPSKHTAVLESPVFRTIVVGVDSLDAACEAAKALVAEGVQLIELCGGFDEQESRAVIAAIQGAVPVGCIAYFPEEAHKLEQFLQDSQP